MKVIITGGAGFLGRRLTRRLLEKGSLTDSENRVVDVSHIVVFDSHCGSDGAVTDSRVTHTQGDIADRVCVAKLIDRPDIAVFHLASVVSAGAEQDFDLAMRVNLEGHINVLEALRAQGSRPRYVFASSLAVYGGEHVREGAHDLTRQVPQTTYGTTKAIGELLVNDYTRKGFIDGRTARLGIVIVRPGAPNKAASAFASAVIREPLNGIDYVLPVPLTTRIAVLGYRTVIDGLVALHDLDGARLGADRALNLPTLTLTVAEMIDSLQRVARGRVLGAICAEYDAFTTNMVSGWPQSLNSARARKLGLPCDAGLDAIIHEYISDYVT